MDDQAIREARGHREKGKAQVRAAAVEAAKATQRLDAWVTACQEEKEIVDAAREATAAAEKVRALLFADDDGAVAVFDRAYAGTA